MEVGSGYMIQVEIEGFRGMLMRDLDFSLEFYVYQNRRVKLSKSELLHIEKESGDLYFALLDSRVLGAGRLMCNVRITDPEPRWREKNARPVILTRDTRVTIGGVEPTRLYSVMKGRCREEWDGGYAVRFNEVWSIPKAEVAYIFYGKVVDQISSFEEITEEMLLDAQNTIVSVSAGTMGKTGIAGVEPGNKVLVLIPADYDYVATKDDGIGGKMAFDESVMGANGGVTVTVDGVEYRVYGEMMLVGGEVFVYVD